VNYKIDLTYRKWDNGHMGFGGEWDYYDKTIIIENAELTVENLFEVIRQTTKLDVTSISKIDRMIK
jgi:hypothetical protein